MIIERRPCTSRTQPVSRTKGLGMQQNNTSDIYLSAHRKSPCKRHDQVPASNLGQKEVTAKSKSTFDQLRSYLTIPRKLFEIYPVVSNLAMTGNETKDGPLAIPAYLLESPLIKNSVSTPSSALQAATVVECLPYLNGLNTQSAPFDPRCYLSNGLLTLQRDKHIEFLHDTLSDYPAPYVGIDAARPWMLYWALTALHFLGEDVTVYREQVVKTFFPVQNATGGFGGGQGHLSHLAGTYATVLSLALVGGVEAWSLANRKTMWEWLGRLKQANGGFKICEDGEEDARGAYCALVVISLLNLPWKLPPSSPAREQGHETFGDGLGCWISRCQTYEGGIAAAPGNEAHGAYALCAVASLCLLDRPDRSLKQFLDIHALIQWLSSRQHAPEGGLAGRTNKVVDGCYSHWIGGIWPMLQAALAGPQSSASSAIEQDSDLYSTEGLARYILNCCQDPEGGLRDKPSKNPDSYHSCYTLTGLSNTDHLHYFEDEEANSESRFAWAFRWKSIRRQDINPREPSHYSGNFSLGPKSEGWQSQKSETDFKPDCGLQAVHPVYVIPHDAAMNIRLWALQQGEIG